MGLRWGSELDIAIQAVADFNRQIQTLAAAKQWGFLLSDYQTANLTFRLIKVQNEMTREFSFAQEDCAARFAM